MNTRLIFGLAVGGLVLAGTAQDAPVTLTGNFLEVGTSDFGTFGSDGKHCAGYPA